MIQENGAASEAVAAALRLALGVAEDHPPPRDWTMVLAVAGAERLGALAWLRSGDFIRRSAPASVVSAWRDGMLRVHDRACGQWARIADLARAFDAEGVSATVLKGLPLAHGLYGDIAARSSCDIDLLIDAGDRMTAGQVLRRSGWTRWSGEAPWHESYLLAENDRTLYLELHSCLVSEALGHRTPLTVAHEPWEHDGAEVRVLAGVALPVYLAANMAKHSPVCLLSFVDLSCLWARLDTAQRRAAVAIAQAARLERTLRWALDRGDAVPLAACGDATALRLLGVTVSRRVAAHAYFRLVWLADTPMDGLRVLSNWVWPQSIRPSLSALLAFWSRRMRRSFAGRFIYRRSYAT